MTTDEPEPTDPSTPGIGDDADHADDADQAHADGSAAVRGADQPAAVAGEGNDPLPINAKNLREDADGSTRRRATMAVAGAIAFVLLVVIVIVSTRQTTVTATVSAAEARPGTTQAHVEPTDTAPPGDDVVEDTTPSTEAPAPEEPDTPIAFNRPSTVLTGKTTGNIPVYSAPGGGQKMTLPNPRRVNDDDPNSTVPLILLAKQQQGDWIEAYLPVRPNGATGWVRKSDFTLSTHDYRIEVHLNAFNLKVFNGDKLIMNTGIGVATAASPTPGGLFYTIELLKPPDQNGAYGPYAYGLSGYSEVYTSFGGGPGRLGLHGTNQPGSIGQRVSHGCIRLRNQDITTLATTLPLGVPVLVYRN